MGPDGFQPASLTRPAGRFLLAINNRSGLKELTFQLTREDGKLMQEGPSKSKTAQLEKSRELAGRNVSTN